MHILQMIPSVLHPALSIGIVASISCGIIGSFVVVKRISFISGSIGHAAFGGVGIGYWLGINPLWGALSFGMVSAMIMGWIRLQFRQREDTLIGAVWAVGMAVGILFIQITPGYASDLFSYMFGNILLTDMRDVMRMLVVSLGIMGIIGVGYRGFYAIAFDEEYAKTRNLPVTWLYIVLLILIALTVVILIRLVGIILVVSMLTMPSATAGLLSSNLKQMMGISILMGMVSTTAGILISYQWDLPSGPLIILVSLGMYMAVLGGQHFKTIIRHR